MLTQVAPTQDIDLVRFKDQAESLQTRIKYQSEHWDSLLRNVRPLSILSKGIKPTPLERADIQVIQTQRLFGQGSASELPHGYQRPNSLIETTFSELGRLSRAKKVGGQNTLVVPRTSKGTIRIDNYSSLLEFAIDKTINITKTDSYVDLGKEIIVCTDMNSLQHLRDSVFLRCDRIQDRAHNHWEGSFTSSHAACIIKDTLYWEAPDTSNSRADPQAGSQSPLHLSLEPPSYYKEIAQMNKLKLSQKPMKDVYMHELIWTMNEPFFLLHSSLCIHKGYLQLVRARDPNDPTDFPRMNYLSSERDLRCRLCREQVPTYIISNETQLVPESPFLLCKSCVVYAYGNRDEHEAEAAGTMDDMKSLIHRVSAERNITFDPYRLV